MNPLLFLFVAIGAGLLCSGIVIAVGLLVAHYTFR